MIKTATVDLEARLELIDGKLESMFEQTPTETGSDDTELVQLKEDRLSTQTCLDICARLSDQINKVPLRPVSAGRRPLDPFPSERITNEGLKECRETLNSTAEKLARHMEGLIEQLKTKMGSEDVAAELALLQEEWGTARQCIDICSAAEQNISYIDNYATGDDSIQYLVSTKGKTIHGRNRGYGLRTKQVGGHLSDESLQQISRDLARSSIQYTEDQRPESRDNAPRVSRDVERESSEEFRKRHGTGFELGSKSAPHITVSSNGSGGE